IDRLADVRRRFPRALLLGARGDLGARPLAGGAGAELLVAAAPVPALLAGAAGSPLALDEERLPFAERSFDLVLGPLLVHHATDLPRVLIQLRRALRPDGLLLASVL